MELFGICLAKNRDNYSMMEAAFLQPPFCKGLGPSVAGLSNILWSIWLERNDRIFRGWEEVHLLLC